MWGARGRGRICVHRTHHETKARGVVAIFVLRSPSAELVFVCMRCLDHSLQSWDRPVDGVGARQRVGTAV